MDDDLLTYVYPRTLKEAFGDGPHQVTSMEEAYGPDAYGEHRPMDRQDRPVMWACAVAIAVLATLAVLSWR